MQTLLLAVLAAASAEATSSPSASSAEPRTAVIAVGRCDDPRLGLATRALRDELRQQQGMAVLLEDDTARPAGGLLTATVEEIRQTINRGRSQFFGLDYGTAENTLRKVLSDIDRLPPGPDRWELSTLARVEVAHVSVFNQKRTLAAEMLFEAVRIQEDLQLDRHLYPPLLRGELDRARRSVQKAKRHTLRVLSRSSYPLFLNGREVGKTPFERALVEGVYEVIVGDPGAHSFARRLDLRADREIAVEVPREARFKGQAGPCYEADPTPEERLEASSVVAGALAAERVVTVRIESVKGEEHVIAALFDASLGRELREAKQRSERGQVLSFRKLAAAVLKGEPAPPEPEAPEPPKALPASALPLPPAPLPPEGPAAGSGWVMASGVVLGAAAIGLGVAALVENGRVSQAKADVATMTAGHQGRAPAELADQVAAKLRDFERAQELRTAFAIGAAASALGSGGLLWLSLAPAGPRSQAAVSVALSGRFP
jgi:hypothetical protein